MAVPARLHCIPVTSLAGRGAPLAALLAAALAAPVAAAAETSAADASIASSLVAVVPNLDTAFAESGLPGPAVGLWIPGEGDWVAMRGVADLALNPLIQPIADPAGKCSG